MNLNPLKAKLMAFMQGRYGPDPMYKGLFGLSIGLLVLNMIIGSGVLGFLAMAVIIYSLFRFFSKNRALRAAENQRYLAFMDKARKKWLLTRNRLKFFRTHRYRTCPSCKTPLRLEKKVGAMHVTCPVCKNSFDVTIRF
ncbi:MAG: hypothetical protein PHN46_05335 [Eubacteriales bacterium]|jgi:LSD1 subclass zinc finger protein|nr:hypothetical protein [Eubacteriales bacterium]NLO12720.1 hypothetical protein [Clostridiales bacterium]